MSDYKEEQKKTKEALRPTVLWDSKTKGTLNLKIKKFKRSQKQYNMPQAGSALKIYKENAYKSMVE